MTLKSKLNFGLGFLFLIIIALIIFSSLYLGKLAQDARNILKDNYASVVYAKNMFSALDDMALAIYNIATQGNGSDSSLDYASLLEKGRAEFERNLAAEQGNITEVNESDYVETLANDYAAFSALCSKIIDATVNGTVPKSGDFPVAYAKLRVSVDRISVINMQALERKNDITAGHAKDFNTIMAIIGAICILLATGYFWYFPMYVSSSISYLSCRIMDLLRKIGIKTEIKTNDEAIVIKRSIDLLDEKFGTTGESKDCGQGAAGSIGDAP